MKKVSVFLAEGFEEIEGLTVVDLLRRAGIEVTTVSVTEELLVRGSHNIPVKADCLFEEADIDGQDMLVLPGGMPGTKNLAAHEGLVEALGRFYREEKYVAAICAAPTVFGELGFLNGREAVCYPGMEEKLLGAVVGETAVAVSGHVITSRGLGTAIDFALRLIEALAGASAAEQIAQSVVYQQNRRTRS